MSLLLWCPDQQQEEQGEQQCSAAITTSQSSASASAVAGMAAHCDCPDAHCTGVQVHKPCAAADWRAASLQVSAHCCTAAWLPGLLQLSAGSRAGRGWPAGYMPLQRQQAGSISLGVHFRMTINDM